MTSLCQTLWPANIFTAWGFRKSNFCRSWLPLRPLSEGSLINVNKVKSRKQIGKNFCSFLFMLNFGNQFPFRILFRILLVIVVNCNLIISIRAAWPIKFTEGSKSGKSTHYLSIYLQRIKKPKGRHMKRRGDRGGPLFEMEGQNEQTNDDLISKLKFVFARKNVCLPPSHKL